MKIEVVPHVQRQLVEMPSGVWLLLPLSGNLKRKKRVEGLK